MAEEDRQGWWNVLPADAWTCPSCKTTSPVENWRETRVACDDCGDHDARECPVCEELFDHVWGDRRIQEANERNTG
jgi:RNA polymerase subunit RPABC4/transcription elongation factor Spt4